MPISQSRMIALINSAIDYKQALDKLIDIIHNTPPETPSEHLFIFAHLPSLLNDPINTPATIAVEYHHFKHNARRNDRHARKAAVRRQQQGLMPRSTTPRDTRLTSASSTFLPANLQHPNYTSTPLTQQQKQKIIDEIDAGIYEEKPAKLTEIGSNLPATTKAQILAQIDEDLANSSIPSCPTCGKYDIYSCPRGISNCKWHERIIQLEAETARTADEDFEEGLN